MLQNLPSIYKTLKDHLKGAVKTHLEIDKHINDKNNPHQVSTTGLSDTIEFVTEEGSHTVVIADGLIQSWDIA